MISKQITGPLALQLAIRFCAWLLAQRHLIVDYSNRNLLFAFWTIQWKINYDRTREHLCPCFPLAVWTMNPFGLFTIIVAANGQVLVIQSVQLYIHNTCCIESKNKQDVTDYLCSWKAHSK